MGDPARTDDPNGVNYWGNSKWARAVPLTLGLCERVMANCFVNQSYDPSRNGTCPTKIFEFHDLGFERENLLRGFPVDYRFH